jgi:hypothetical protein
LPPGTTGDTGYVTHYVDLLAAAPSIAGQTVRINFHEYVPQTFTGPAQFDLDGASLTFFNSFSIKKVELGQSSYSKVSPAAGTSPSGFTPKDRSAYLAMKEKALALVGDSEPEVRTGSESPSIKETGAPVGTFIEAEGLGGPDSYGYTFISSDEPGGPSFNWIEISQTGTNLNLTDDSSVFPISLPFNFNFYNTNYTQAAVGSNGTVYFSNQYLGLSNVCIPGTNTYGVQRFIALYWDDLYPSGTNNVYYKIVGSAPNRMLVVQWQHVLHYGSSTDFVTAQAQLLENGDILLLYANPSSEAGSNAIVGIQNDISTGLAYLCRQASLHSGLAILFTRNGTTYNVYFDTVNPPATLIHSGLTGTSCAPVPYPLACGMTYYWQVVASNLSGCQTIGPAWSFTTPTFIGDLDHNCRVDFDDFAIMGQEWHTNGIKADIYKDGNNRVDLMDLAVLAEEWLK